MADYESLAGSNGMSKRSKLILVAILAVCGLAIIGTVASSDNTRPFTKLMATASAGGSAGVEAGSQPAGEAEPEEYEEYIDEADDWMPESEDEWVEEIGLLEEDAAWFVEEDPAIGKELQEAVDILKAKLAAMETELSMPHPNADNIHVAEVAVRDAYEEVMALLEILDQRFEEANGEDIEDFNEEIPINEEMFKEDMKRLHDEHAFFAGNPDLKADEEKFEKDIQATEADNAKGDRIARLHDFENAVHDEQAIEEADEKTHPAPATEKGAGKSKGKGEGKGAGKAVEPAAATATVQAPAVTTGAAVQTPVVTAGATVQTPAVGATATAA